MVRRLQHVETMRAGAAPSLPHIGIVTSGHACLGRPVATLRLEKRAFGPYGPPIMRVGHVAGYGVKSNNQIKSSKVVRFTWDTALCKCAPLLDPPLTSSWNTRHGFLRGNTFSCHFYVKNHFFQSHSPRRRALREIF